MTPSTSSSSIATSSSIYSSSPRDKNGQSTSGEPAQSEESEKQDDIPTIQVDSSHVVASTTTDAKRSKNGKNRSERMDEMSKDSDRSLNESGSSRGSSRRSASKNSSKSSSRSKSNSPHAANKAPSTPSDDATSKNEANGGSPVADEVKVKRSSRQEGLKADAKAKKRREKPKVAGLLDSKGKLAAPDWDNLPFRCV